MPTHLHIAENDADADIFMGKVIQAIIAVESNYRPHAVSTKGAIGLMQVRYSVWHTELKKMGIIESEQCLLNPRKNIRAGTYILGQYLKSTNGNLEKTLKKYSGGAKNYYKKVIKEMEKNND